MTCTVPRVRSHKIDTSDPVATGALGADTLGDVTGVGVLVTIDRFAESSASGTSISTVPAPSAGEA